MRGFKEREGVNFSETFAPTVSNSCVRLRSAIACECDLDLCPFNVDQSFVQSDLEDVFLRLQKGCSDQQHADMLKKVLAFDFFAIHWSFLTNLSD